ncbi:MAG: T9SS type A sorting domain-containing protein [bacterium]|nr:T9SS type A sorting domain-containing protein [Candidatus Kapabacteria bacterium]
MTLVFEIIEPGMTTLALYDVLGKRVFDIVSKDLPAGQYPIELDAGAIAGGTYFLVLDTPSGRIVKPMQVAR